MTISAYRRLNVRDLIRRTIRAEPKMTVRELAAKVESEIPDDQLRDILRRILPLAISPELRPIHIPANTYQGTDRVDKATARREMTRTGAWPVLVPPEMGGGWRQLRDLTPEDLEKLAARYDLKASEAAANARKYRRLATAVRDAGLTTVGELRRERVMMILGVEDEAGITFLIRSSL